MKIPHDESNGISLLLRAWQYAVEVSRPVREFAVEIDRLRSSGLDDCKLRLLICKGCIEHLAETFFPGQSERTLVPTQSLAFTSGSCFVLTENGFALATSERGKCSWFNGNGTSTSRTSRMAAKSSGEKIPAWDFSTRQLTFGRQIVKIFRVPADNQELVLNAFQQAGWPRHLDDPFPPSMAVDGKRRLRSVIESLNRNQQAGLIHFFGDGRGTGVCWRYRGALRNRRT